MTFALARHGSFTALALLASLGSSLIACSGSSTAPGSPTPNLAEGQSDFKSAPPGSSQGRGGSLTAAGDAAVAPEASNGSMSSSGGAAAPRKVEETDLYRLDGDRLYYLNQYRGLMVFDVSDVDHPRLLGRSAIYGSPIEMVVRDGIASVVVADWYGKMDDGTPFHGSIVRGIDARDPANMKITGEALLGGWVRDTRVVGDVLYAVTEKSPYDYGWYGGLDVADGGVGVSTATGGNSVKVSVASVSFAGGKITAVDNYDVPGYGGIFNVTSDSIMLASEVIANPDKNGYGQSTGKSELRFLDISDPAGQIVERGSVIVDGSVQSWGADNGRWNLDFADGKIAHVVGRTYAYSTGASNSMIISTADFSDPEKPRVTGTLETPMPGWDAAVRFDGTRLYLTPTNWGCGYYGGDQASGTVRTPLDVYDLSDVTKPVKLGSSSIAGQVSLMIPNGQRLFALGNNYDCSNGYQSPVALSYFDVTDPTAPKALGSAEFGKGWAWTPAAGTFKAFTKDDGQGLVVLPFSGWDPAGYQYNNGLQLIEFTPASIATSGTAKTRGWVERGIFVKNRLVSLSDLALSVVDYTSHDEPNVVTELTLARNVVNVKPAGKNLVEVSSDFWDNDTDHSELRLLPIAEAEENVSDATLSEAQIQGINPSVFHNGDVSYIVSNVRHEIECPANSGGSYPGKGAAPEQTTEPKCYSWTQEVQVVETKAGRVSLRGKVALPDLGQNYYGWGWGWYGCTMYDWYYGADVVQVDGSKLAFRRWMPQYDSNGNYVDALQSLYVVDATSADAPTIASVVVTKDKDGWWGNLRAIGSELYASHYDWEEQSHQGSDGVWYPGVVRYYIDHVDLSDPAHPRISQKINVPGFLVGGSEDDPSLVYTMDYHWDGQRTFNDLAVLKLSGDRAYLQGHVSIPGSTGGVFVHGSTAYFSAETWDQEKSSMRLYQVDLSDPKNPTVLPSKETQGWGWLLAVEGDRAFVTSGWGNQGIDVFKLQSGAAPTYDQFVRTRGWWASSIARQDDQVLLASGYWGTQVIDLK